MSKVLLWGLAITGAGIGIFGASLFWVQQAAISDERIWPLPALVLIEWAFLGLASLVGAVESARTGSRRWISIAWAACGALVPMAILGGFSIGEMVCLSMLPLFGAILIATRLGKSNFLYGLIYFGFGVILNLGILIFLSIMNAGA